MERTIEEINEIVRNLLEVNQTRNVEEQFCILMGMSHMDLRVCDTKAFHEWCMKNNSTALKHV